MAILIEHHAGALPTWLSPEQVIVAPVRDDHADYAHDLNAKLTARGVRSSVLEATEPLGARIRRAKLDKVPYILVVGDDDVAAGTLGVNRRGSDVPERGVDADQFVHDVVAEIDERRSPERAS